MKLTSLNKDLQFLDDKPAVTVMMETGNTKEIRIAFKEGQQMIDHKVGHPITVEVFKGKIDFGVEGEIHHFEAGDMIALPGNVIHNLTAMEESVVRLSLSKEDNAERIKKIAAAQPQNK